MINEISKKAGKYLDYAVELLKELIAHKSVAAEAQKGMPYGRDCADCLAFAEDFLKKEGYIVRNFDNHAITADFGGGNAELGILCHLDVVPTDGQKWTSDPFKPEIREGRIYGRGAIDDKGGCYHCHEDDKGQRHKGQQKLPPYPWQQRGKRFYGYGILHLKGKLPANAVHSRRRVPHYQHRKGHDKVRYELLFR